MPWTTVSLGLAGALGVLARHFLQRAIPRPGAMPWGTLAVNVSGAFVLGMLVAVIARRGSVPMWIQEALMVGFLGGYTTFSALSAETFRMIETREFALAALYSLGSLVTGLAAVWAGVLIGRCLA